MDFSRENKAKPAEWNQTTRAQAWDQLVAPAFETKLSVAVISMRMSELPESRIREVIDSKLYHRFHPDSNSAGMQRAALEVLSKRNGGLDLENSPNIFLDPNISSAYLEIIEEIKVRSEAWYESYLLRQVKIASEFAKIVTVELSKFDPQMELTPQNFHDLFRSKTFDAAKRAGYFKADRAAAWSIPLVAAALDDGRFAMEVEAAFLRPYLQKYEVLRENFGVSGTYKFGD